MTTAYPANWHDKPASPSQPCAHTKRTETISPRSSLPPPQLPPIFSSSSTGLPERQQQPRSTPSRGGHFGQGTSGGFTAINRSGSTMQPTSSTLRNKWIVAAADRRILGRNSEHFNRGYKPVDETKPEDPQLQPPHYEDMRRECQSNVTIEGEEVEDIKLNSDFIVWMGD